MPNSDLINFFKNAAPILLAIFVAVLISIILTRIAVRIFLLFAKKNYQNLVKKIQSKKAIKAEKVLPKADSEKFIKKEKSRGLVEVMTPELEESAELDETQIVDIVRPVGFWTSMILGQKLTYLVSSAKIMNKKRKKGFWESMVEAQEQAQGRERGRGL